MKIVLYNNKTENNRLDKTHFLTKIIELEGTLRMDTSILNPSLILDLNPKGLNQKVLVSESVEDDLNRDVVDDNSRKVYYDKLNEILGCNYVYIPSFNRYYFTTNISVINNQLWNISLNVDVLMSYKDTISDIECLVARNQYEFNPKIVDNNEFFEYSNSIIEYKPEELELPQGSTKTPFIPDLINTREYMTDRTKHNYMLNVINDITLLDAPVIKSLVPFEPFVKMFPPIIDTPISDGSMYSCRYSLNNIVAKQLKSQLMTNTTINSDLTAFIKSFMVFPFDIPHRLDYDISDYRFLKFGRNFLPLTSHREDVGYCSPLVCPYLFNSYFRINGEFGDYRDLSPYTTYEIYLPYIGYVKVDNEMVINSNILIMYYVNYDDGSAIAYILNTTKGLIVGSYQCQLGIQIPYSSTNALDVSRNTFSNSTSLILNILGSIGALASGNPIAIGGGLLNLGKGIGSYVSNDLANINTGSGTISNPTTNVYAPYEVRIRKITKNRLFTGSEELKYNSLYGKPLNALKRLKTLKGYTQVGEIHLDKLNNAMIGEVTEIESILKSGIII